MPPLAFESIMGRLRIGERLALQAEIDKLKATADRYRVERDKEAKARKDAEALAAATLVEASLVEELCQAAAPFVEYRQSIKKSDWERVRMAVEAIRAAQE